jgi:UDP-N-acetylmuramate dehydrogenase
MGIIQSNYSLTESNSLAVPSIAEHFIRIESLEDLESAKDFADENDLKIFPIGEGSNLVLRPIIPGLVAQIALTGIASIEESETDVLIEVYAGENWHQSVSWCLQNNYFGIESLALIPGSVGAAPVQNIGAYGAEIAEYLERLEYFDLVTGKLVELSADQCGFAYRDSRFKSSRTKSDYPSLKSYMDELGLAGSAANVFDAVCAVRRSRLPDPIIHPNVGSFFHNPVVPEQQHKDLLKIFPEMPGYPSSLGGVKIPAAWLIEFLGLKGQEISRVKISDQHALVLTNINKQDANAVLDAASKIQDLVKETFAIQLNIEPRVYPD